MDAGTNPLLEPFRATAETAIRDRPAVDPDMIREIFDEAAVMLHNGLALDGLDGHDTRFTVDALGSDLCAPDPGAAIRARAGATLNESSAHVHDPEGVAAALLVSAAMLQI